MEEDPLVDTNLLLLWIIGAIDRNYIGKFARTSTFSPSDYDVLNRTLDAFLELGGSRIVVTPSILTEVSNLANDLKGTIRSEFFAKLAQAVEVLLVEQFVPSKHLCGQPQFEVFGLTDMGILHVAKGKYRVLTEDGKLGAYLMRQGVNILTLELMRAIS